MAFTEALADHCVDGAFDEAGGDALAIASPRVAEKGETHEGGKKRRGANLSDLYSKPDDTGIKRSVFTSIGMIDIFLLHPTGFS